MYRQREQFYKKYSAFYQGFYKKILCVLLKKLINFICLFCSSFWKTMHFTIKIYQKNMLFLKTCNSPQAKTLIASIRFYPFLVKMSIRFYSYSFDNTIKIEPNFNSRKIPRKNVVIRSKVPRKNVETYRNFYGKCFYFC